MNLQKQLQQAQKMATVNKTAAVQMLTAIYRAQLTAKGQKIVQDQINQITQN